MTQIEVLITKARHYCIDNIKYWEEAYDKQQSNRHSYPYTYSNKDYDIFPRYNVLYAIQEGVEMLVGHPFSSIDDAKKALINAGENSHTISTIESNDELYLLGELAKDFSKSGKLNEIEKRAIQEERHKFCAFIQSLSEDDLWYVAPLPYRRKMKSDEIKNLKQVLLATWNYDLGYDWNLTDQRNKKETMLVMAKNLSPDDKRAIKHAIAKRTRSGHVFHFTENYTCYELDASCLDFSYLANFSESMDWLIHVSPDNAVTFAGEWLTKLIRELFINRENELNKWERS